MGNSVIVIPHFNHRWQNRRELDQVSYVETRCIFPMGESWAECLKEGVLI